MVESLPANAGHTGSSPGLGGSNMPQSGWARGPQLLILCIWSLCSATREAATVKGPRTAMRSGPRLLQLEKALAQKRRLGTAIKQILKTIFLMLLGKKGLLRINFKPNFSNILIKKSFLLSTKGCVLYNYSDKKILNSLYQ